jgi:hypothetical protein
MSQAGFRRRRYVSARCGVATGGAHRRESGDFPRGQRTGHAWPERRAVPATEKLSFYCECADPHCFDRVYLTAPEYEAIRADSSRFAVVPGHVYPEAETVVEEADGYDVVEKIKHVRGITERTDPRKGAYS